MQLNIANKPPKLVEDWNFTFVNGFLLSISVDAAQGDTVIQDPEARTIEFYIEERPSLVDPEVAAFGKEHITIYLPNVLSLSRRMRAIQDATPEQQEELKQTYRNFTNLSH
jgi:hypothetical protein